jgi:hypothetical protein
MRSTRPDLIVPVRDRRQRRRILTLKNFRNAVVVMVVLVAGVYAEEYFRNQQGPSADYGRLYNAEIQSVTAVSKTPTIVTEAKVDDHDSADPFLIRAAAREQLLMAESNVPQPVPEAPIVAQPVTQPQEPLVGYDKDGRMVITGGPEGVTLAKQTSAKPVLGGGFGRQ